MGNATSKPDEKQQPLVKQVPGRIDFRSIFPRKQSEPLTAGPDLKLKKKKGKLGVARDTLIVVALGALIYKTVVEPRLVKDKNSSAEPNLPKDKPVLPAEL